MPRLSFAAHCKKCLHRVAIARLRRRCAGRGNSVTPHEIDERRDRELTEWLDARLAVGGSGHVYALVPAPGLLPSATAAAMLSGIDALLARRAAEARPPALAVAATAVAAIAVAAIASASINARFMTPRFFPSRSCTTGIPLRVVSNAAAAAAAAAYHGLPL